MVNLSKEEIKNLTGRKDWLAKDMNPIYVTLAVRRGKLTQGLKWYIDNCNTIYHSKEKTKGLNYNFIFQVASFDEMGLFYNCANLILMEYNDYGEIVPITHYKTGGYFAFSIKLEDLDKYFKRYYTYNALDGLGKEKYFYINQAGVNFEVVIDKIHKTVSVTNLTKLLVDNKSEPYFTAKAFCHKNDYFNFRVGKEIAEEKWNKKWKAWFDKTIKAKKLAEVEKPNENSEENKENEDKQDMIIAYNKQTVKLTKVDEFVGTHFGDYVVVGVHHRDNNKHVYWDLECEYCHKHIQATKSNLIKGKTNVKCSCGDKECTLRPNSNDENNNTTTDFNFGSNDIASDIKDSYFPDEYFDTEEEKQFAMMDMEQDGVVLVENYKDLFSMPVWFHIAHCITADLSLYGEIARTINHYWQIKSALNYRTPLLTIGTAIKIGNVFNLIAASKKFVRTDMETLEKCVEDLAVKCWYGNIHCLAMPRIGCGSNKLNWDEVKEMILDTFKRIYKNFNEGSDSKETIFIVVCNKKSEV